MAPFALILMALGGALFWAVPAGAAAASGPWSRCAGHGDRCGTGPVGLAARLDLHRLLPGPRSATHGSTTPVAQMAAWTGALGLGTLTMALAALPVLLRGRAVMATALAAAMLAGPWIAGRDDAAGRADARRPPVTLRIVQPDAAQHLKWDPEWSTVFFQRCWNVRRTRPRDLVIWPETAVNFLLEDADAVLPMMSQAASAPLVMGIQRREGSASSTAWRPSCRADRSPRSMTSSSGAVRRIRPLGRRAGPSGHRRLCRAAGQRLFRRSRTADHVRAGRPRLSAADLL